MSVIKLAEERRQIDAISSRGQCGSCNALTEVEVQEKPPDYRVFAGRKDSAADSREEPRLASPRIAIAIAKVS